MARKMVREIQPCLVISVACERDLVSGIRDIAPSIPVIGIPNVRPSGPCKNTTVDTAQIERVMEFFLGRNRI
jgi:hypothetical protein